RFTIICCTPPDEFLAELAEQVFRHPELRKTLPIVFGWQGLGLQSIVQGASPPIEFHLRRVEPLVGSPFADGLILLPGMSGVTNLRFGEERAVEVRTAERTR